MTAMPIDLMTEEEVARYGHVEDAGFGALRTERGLLPLTAMDVDVKVAGVVASIELAQTFVNTTGAAIEATYIFPLPDRAAVHRFRMEVAGRVIGQRKDVGRLDRGAGRVDERLRDVDRRDDSRHARIDVHRRERQQPAVGLQAPEPSVLLAADSRDLLLGHQHDRQCTHDSSSVAPSGTVSPRLASSATNGAAAARSAWTSADAMDAPSGSAMTT